MPTILPQVADEKAPPAVGEVYGMLQQAMGGVPPLARIIANAPDVLGPFMGFAGVSFREDAVSLELKELAVMRVSELNGCNYCREWHGPMLDKVGIGGDRRAGLATPGAPSSIFNPKEQAVLRLADEMTTQVCATPDTVKFAVAQLGDAGTMEVMMTIGLYNLINRVARSCGLTTVNP